MRSTTSSFHSSSHGESEAPDARAVATSSTVRCRTTHARAWAEASSSRWASSRRRTSGASPASSASDWPSTRTVRAKLPIENSSSPSSGSSPDNGRPARDEAPVSATTYGARPSITRPSSARAASAVLPTPASPTTSTLRPSRRHSRSCSTASRRDAGMTRWRDANGVGPCVLTGTGATGSTSRSSRATARDERGEAGTTSMPFNGVSRTLVLIMDCGRGQVTTPLVRWNRFRPVARATDLGPDSATLRSDYR